MSTLNQIEFLLEKNRQLIADLHSISDAVRLDIDNNVDAMQNIDVDLMNSRLIQSQIIQKKIEDNTASINNLSAKYSPSAADLDAAVTSFFKKATFVSSNFSSSMTASIHTMDIRFKNEGVFFSWNGGKNISLETYLLSEGNVVAYHSSGALDLNLNTPGDELTNGDFGLTKTFVPTIDLSGVSAGTYILKMYIKDLTDNFDDAYTGTITIT